MISPHLQRRYAMFMGAVETGNGGGGEFIELTRCMGPNIDFAGFFWRGGRLYLQGSGSSSSRSKSGFLV